jgi:hypothetical protein
VSFKGGWFFALIKLTNVHSDKAAPGEAVEQAVDITHRPGLPPKIFVASYVAAMNAQRDLLGESHLHVDYNCGHT